MSKKAPGVSDRRRFMKQVLGTLAGGVGIALLPKAAWAGTAVCCQDLSCPNCLPAGTRYKCNGCDTQFCICHQPAGQCFSIEC
jgi:hypothetical protein